MSSTPSTSASANHQPRPIKVVMLDLWATVPYYTAYLSRALLAEGTNVQIASMAYYLDPECFRSRGLQLDPGAINLVGRFRGLPKTARRALKFAEGLANLSALTLRSLFRPPDILHVQFLPLLRSRFPVDLWFVRFSRSRGSKIVLTVHDLLPHDTAERFKSLYRQLYVQMDALICHSDHVKSRLESEFGISPEKISVIPHGPFFYDLPPTDSASTLQSMGVGQHSEMVLWQGIIFPYKGVDLLLNAWQHVEQQSSTLTLVVLGTGDLALTSTLEQQARALGLERVRFHLRFCSAEELVAAYRAAAMVIYPYRAITTSGALATGLALGKPIIASNLPVFRELLTDGETSLLIDPHNSTELADAILTLGRDRALRERLSNAVLAMQFGSQSWTGIAIKTAALYRQLLNEPKKR